MTASTAADGRGRRAEALGRSPWRRRVGPPLVLGANLATLASLVFTLAVPLKAYSSIADLLVQFLLQACLGTGALTLLWLGLRRWAKAGLAGLCCVVQVAAIDPDLGGKPIAAGDAGVAIMFANVLQDNPDRAAVAERIRELDPDVVVLAEVDRRWRRDLGAIWGDAYPYVSTCIDEARCDVAVLSRLKGTPSTLVAKGYAAALRIETGAGSIDIVGTHLYRPLPKGAVTKQMLQGKDFSAFVRDKGAATVLFGDFNAVPWGRVIGSIEAATGLRSDRGVEGTWPSLLPWPLRLPIDHVLASDKLRLIERRVINVPGSDHLGLYVRVAR